MANNANDEESLLGSNAMNGESDGEVVNNESDDEVAQVDTAAEAVSSSVAGNLFLPTDAAFSTIVADAEPKNNSVVNFVPNMILKAPSFSEDNHIARNGSDMRNISEHVYEDLCYVSLDLPSKTQQPSASMPAPPGAFSGAQQPSTISGPTRATTITAAASDKLRTANEYPEPKCKREHCLLELLTTERNYVDALNMICREFVRPLSAVTIPSHPNDSAKEWAKIFNNLENLVVLHTHFNAELRRACQNAFDLPDISRVRSPTPSAAPASIQALLQNGSGSENACIGSKIYVCFANTRMRFTEYASFCRFLPAAQEKLDSLCQHDDVVKQHVHDCQQKANNGRFMLRDLLSVPFQRITKYPLMLKELAKHFQHDGYAADARWLQLADDLMLDVNFYVNEVKRDQELLDQYEKITSNIRLEMPRNVRLSDYGRMHHDGELRMRTHGQNKTLLRHIFVFDRVMLICKTHRRPPGVSGTKISFHEALVMSDHRIEAIDTSVTNGGGGDWPLGKSGQKQWTFSFNLVKLDLSAVHTLTAKTDEQRRDWMLALGTAIDNARPSAAAHSRIDHRYEFHTFDTSTACTTCGKLLRGLFWQGYLCTRQPLGACGASVHKECIAASNGTCAVSTNNRATATMRRNSGTAVIQAATSGAGNDAEALATMLRTTLQRSHAAHVALETQTASRRSLGTAKAVRAYAPPSNSVDRLTFDEGDIIEILNIPDAQSIWGRNTCTGEQGFCSMAYLVKIQGSNSGAISNNTINNNNGQAQMRRSVSSVMTATSPNQSNLPATARVSESSSFYKPLEEYPWFVGELDRETASVWLNQCPASTFLVRISNRHNERNYAISLKFGDDVRHMLIHQTTDGAFYYLTPTTYFKRIQDLIVYYGQNSLNIAFPGLETRLQHSYKRVVARPSHQPLLVEPSAAQQQHVAAEPTTPIIGYAVARYKFDATSPKMIDLSEGEKIEIISKQGQNRGWWKGRVNDKVGYFPLSYVQQIEDFDVVADDQRTRLTAEPRSSSTSLACLSLNNTASPVKINIKSTAATEEHTEV